MTFDELRLIAGQSDRVRAMLYPLLFLRRRWHMYRESPQRQLLDNCCRFFEGDPVFNLDEFAGRFALGPQSDLFRRILVFGEYEPKLAKACVAHLSPDRDAIDIGANVGFYSVLMARQLRQRRVLSIEPTEAAAARLIGNIKLNGLQDRIIVFQGVASDKSGGAMLNVVPGKEEYSSLGTMAHPSIRGVAAHRIEVKARTVDELVLEHKLDPGFVKIDVEGMEFTVLRGMLKVLAEWQPIILAEASDPLLQANGTSVAEIIEFVKTFGYRVVDPLFQNVKPGTRKFGDILCIPNVRAANASKAKRV